MPEQVGEERIEAQRVQNILPHQEWHNAFKVSNTVFPQSPESNNIHIGIAFVTSLIHGETTFADIAKSSYISNANQKGSIEYHQNAHELVRHANIIHEKGFNIDRKAQLQEIERLWGESKRANLYTFKKLVAIATDKDYGEVKGGDVDAFFRNSDPEYEYQQQRQFVLTLYQTGVDAFSTPEALAVATAFKEKIYEAYSKKGEDSLSEKELEDRKQSLKASYQKSLRAIAKRYVRRETREVPRPLKRAYLDGLVPDSMIDYGY